MIDHSPTRCLAFAGPADAEVLARATGASVVDWSLIVDDHLIRGEE